MFSVRAPHSYKLTREEVVVCVGIEKVSGTISRRVAGQRLRNPSPPLFTKLALLNLGVMNTPWSLQ